MSERSDSSETRGNKFGTFGGVFTPSILTILGAIMFLRANFIVGHAGIIGALLILALAKIITGLTSLSISAVSTNMQVGGGGAYFMISRVLGPQFGGAIGLALFFAQALSVPFYILAFTEALTSSLPALDPYSTWIMMIAAGLLFGVTYVGASWAIKAQYAIMAVLVLAIVAFLGGGLRVFSAETFSANLAASGDPDFPFWVCFAIYFPAVTGILAGINMSGDLANPGRSIPRGTFLAIGVGLLVYLVQILVSGGAIDRQALIDAPYGSLQDGALFGAGFLVAAGVVAATLSSAIGSYMGAPRILQALAKDRILPGFGFFAKGSRDHDEPRRGLVLTAVITFAVLFFGAGAGTKALNVVAPVITMFFLYTYGMINLAAFIEAAGHNPSFRPRFKYFHWAIALLGALGCFGAALLINLFAAVASFAVMAFVYWYITRRELEVTFGDARRGYVFSAVRRNLRALAAMEEDSRNWRPTTLVFSGNPNQRETLVRYAVWLEGGHGIVYLAQILTGTMEEYGPRRITARKQLQTFCREQDIEAFPVVVIADNVTQGVSMLLQTATQGPVSPNLAVFGWSRGGDFLMAYLSHLRMARQMGMSLVALDAASLPVPSQSKRIDIWWRGRENGGLMILLAHLMLQNRGWRRAEVRILRLVQSEAGRQPSVEALQSLIHDARVAAKAQVIVDSKPFVEVMRTHSGNATCIFLGFELPDDEHAADWFAFQHALMEGMPAVILVNSSGQEDHLA